MWNSTINNFPFIINLLYDNLTLFHHKPIQTVRSHRLFWFLHEASQAHKRTAGRVLKEFHSITVLLVKTATTTTDDNLFFFPPPVSLPALPHERFTKITGVLATAQQSEWPLDSSDRWLHKQWPLFLFTCSLALCSKHLLCALTLKETHFGDSTGCFFKKRMFSRMTEGCWWGGQIWNEWKLMRKH